MSEIVAVADHVGEASDRLIGQYKGKPRLEAYLAALVGPLQSVEDALIDILFQSAIDNARGAQLDDLGDLVGQKRAGLVDAAYRPFVKARILVNLSDGLIEQLIAITVAILGDNARVYVRELYPAGIEFEAQSVTVNALILWRDFLHKAVGAAIDVNFIYSTAARTSTLIFDSSYGGVSPTTAQDMGSSYGGVTGGLLSGDFG
jgi:hypothetical protein